MSHHELLKKFLKPGVQGSPCRGVGGPQRTCCSFFARRLRRRERNKTLLGTPQAPAKGSRPLHSRWRNEQNDRFASPKKFGMTHNFTKIVSKGIDPFWRKVWSDS